MGDLLLQTLDPAVTEELCRALEALSRTQNEGAVPWQAMPALARLAQAGHRMDIDLAATHAIGAPVVIARPAPASLERLTARQRQIAGLLAQGWTNKEIARRLGISPATVKDHVHAILSRLGLRRRAEVAALFSVPSS